MSPPLNRTPFWAPIVVPTIVAAGVANPSAQGQAINTDDAKTMSANSKTETLLRRRGHLRRVPTAGLPRRSPQESREEVPDDAPGPRSR